MSGVEQQIQARVEPRLEQPAAVQTLIRQCEDMSAAHRLYQGRVSRVLRRVVQEHEDARASCSNWRSRRLRTECATRAGAAAAFGEEIVAASFRHMIGTNQSARYSC
jgi:hypothetical protein